MESKAQKKARKLAEWKAAQQKKARPIPKTMTDEEQKAAVLSGDFGIITRTTYDSSVIAASAYIVDKKELIIGFKSGEVYKYFNVEPETNYDLVCAESAGKFFNANIRDKYRFEHKNNAA